MTAERHENYYCRVCRNNGSIEEAFGLAKEYAASLKPDVCVSDEEYERRLLACSRCTHLAGGHTCGICGCFVIVRAKKRGMYCPNPNQRMW